MDLTGYFPAKIHIYISQGNNWTQFIYSLPTLAKKQAMHCLRHDAQRTDIPLWLSQKMLTCP